MAVDVDAGRRVSADPGEAEAMAAPVETAEDGAAACDSDEAAQPDRPSEGPTPPRLGSATRAAFIAGCAMIVALTALLGWQGYQLKLARQHEAQRNLYVQAARQAAVNLTTIGFHDTDNDVKRILDGATGTFYDDFSKRSGPFVEVVKQAQSQSTGSVTEAGMESDNGDQASVLVAVTVKTSTAASQDEPPRAWRMRLSMQKVGDSAKVSNVEFVP